MKIIAPFFQVMSLLIIFCFAYGSISAQDPEKLTINDLEYFEMPGLNVTVYHDYYAIGHQSGITIIQNGKRVAANGDIRLSPNQRPYPQNGQRKVDMANNEISVDVGYSETERQKYTDPRTPYPALDINCTVRVKAEGNAFRIIVDLDKPVPEEYEDRIGFNLEFFPGHFFDKTWYMDDTPGTFPRQVNGPVTATENEGEVNIEPMATGKRLVVLPEFENEMITIEAVSGQLELVDGRYMSNNGWYYVRSPLRGGVTQNAVEWLVTPVVIPEYKYEPVIQVSQVGYRTNQKKIAVIELDNRENNPMELSLLRITESGGFETIKSGKPVMWGKFLRYNYAQFDFTDVDIVGMYKMKYGDVVSDPFMIHDDVYKRHVWQPTLEYYLPVQMCHMRINDRVKVWHGLCHDDDALMAPVDHIHFDGYRQGSSTLSKYKPGDPVPGLNVGGWHDAGDYDLRVESQATTTRMLAYCWEMFNAKYDETTVDQKNKLVEIHRPDGKQDVLQQIEHGALTVVGGYKSLGRLYRGIITSTGRQYSLLGDGSVMTDNLFYDASLDPGEVGVGVSGIMDDRWVFTEENPRRELQVAASLATACRSLKGFNDELAKDCIEIAAALWQLYKDSENPGLIDVAVELYLTTGEDEYMNFILDHNNLIVNNLGRTGPAMGRIAPHIKNKKFLEDLTTALREYATEIEEQVNETPYGVSYKPRVWGAGWGIQSFGVNQYFLHKGFPDIFSSDPVFNAMNFVLGVHPGNNTASFVSGVGARSLLVAYGVNRDDWSYIPGGSASGTALIRPDLPELKTWPYLWQQTEYVMGGGALNYMFLVLASDDLLEKE